MKRGTDIGIRDGRIRAYMKVVYGNMEPVPSPWDRRCWVNPAPIAIWRAAKTYFERRNLPLLNRCLRNLVKLERAA